MRGIPRTLGTLDDIRNMAGDLPVVQAEAFVGGLGDDAWARLGASDDDRQEIIRTVADRMAKEDKTARRQKAYALNLRGQIAARSDAEEIARYARRIKEELDDVRVHLADLRAAKVGDEHLKELSARLVELGSMFGAALTRHNALIEELSKLRKKAKDEEEV